MKSTSDGADLRASLSLSLGAAYIIDRELDATGTAHIFVAHEESMDREVAIVVVAEELTRNVSFDRFEREMRRAAMLDEPHTVPVLTVGLTTMGLLYYTMPFVRGMSLRQCIEQGPVGFDESVRVLRDVARAMRYAHGEGFIHRHLIPENVLLTKSAAVVTDFGLARALEESGATAPDALLTHSSYTALPYIAPEQVTGSPPPDHRADIYAWGVMAYELLLDADPFVDVTAPAIAPTVPVTDVPPLQLFKRHGVPEQLAVLVMRCCEYDPAARPASAAELVEVLERIPDRASTLALERKSAARWVGASIVVALALFVASGMAVWRMQKRESREAPLLAVLPFDIAGAPAESLFAERLEDATRARLSGLAGLRVIDAASVRSIVDSLHNARAIGRALGADYVLRTSLSLVHGPNGAQQVRLSPTVLRVADGMTKWGSDADLVSLADPLSLSATLALRTANELDVFLGETERSALAARATSDTGAFAAYMHANRLYGENTSGSVVGFEQALHEYERAYALDPRYAHALGGAALTLARMGDAGARPVRFDSALVLARRALALEAGEPHALDAGALVALAQDRLEDTRSWVDRAVGANPSDIEALQLRAELLPIVGDSAGTWHDVEQIAALAPRSVNALVSAAAGAQMLRRFGDAGVFLQRARLLAPERNDLVLLVARLGRMEGNYQRMARAVREYRRRGGRLTPADLTMLRVGDDAMRRELADSSPAALGVFTHADSATYYTQKANLLLARRDAAAARPRLDSAVVVLQALLADSTLSAAERRRFVDLLAWTDAARGERVKALAVATGVERDTVTLQFPGGQLAATIACNSAEIYAFVDDVDQMISQLRRCLTLPGGYAPNAISAEPSLWRHAIDPRLRALLGEFKLEIRRKE